MNSLKKKHSSSIAVVEYFSVNESACCRESESRVAEMRARAEEVVSMTRRKCCSKRLAGTIVDRALINLKSERRRKTRDGSLAP